MQLTCFFFKIFTDNIIYFKIHKKLVYVFKCKEFLYGPKVLTFDLFCKQLLGNLSGAAVFYFDVLLLAHEPSCKELAGCYKYGTKAPTTFSLLDQRKN